MEEEEEEAEEEAEEAAEEAAERLCFRCLQARSCCVRVPSPKAVGEAAGAAEAEEVANYALTSLVELHCV